MGNDIDNKYVLVLPSWYPSRVHRFNGDFNERLVRAVSAEVKHIVLHIIKDVGIKKTEVELIEEESLITYQIYYPGIKIPILKTIYSAWLYFALNTKYIKKIVDKQGKPSIIHCFVIQRALIIAVLAKMRYNIPLVITEQWSAFFPQAPYALKRVSFVYKWLIRYGLRSADHIIAVSEILKTHIGNWTKNKIISVIPNVVDTTLFTCSSSINTHNFRFLHISTMYPVKNVDGILRAFEEILETHHAELYLVGDMPQSIKDIIHTSPALLSSVVYKGEVPYSEVAGVFKECDCMVMFSHFETFSCVTAEALCSGLPVIITRTFGIGEYVNKENGLVISANNQAELKAAMIGMIDNYENYKREEISDLAKGNFNYRKISKMIGHVYQSVLPQTLSQNA